MRPLSLKQGILPLQAWTLNLTTQKLTNAHIQAPFYALNCVNWLLQILYDLVREIGVALQTDNNKLSGELGHYARVLIDVDLASHLSNNTVLDMDGLVFLFLYFIECLGLPLSWT